MAKTTDIANSSLLTVIKNNGVDLYVHDKQSLHGITPSTGTNASTFVLQWGNPNSTLKDGSTLLYLPEGVALKSDLNSVMVYKGTASSDSSLPTPAAANTGWAYISNAAFTSSYNTVAIEPGDMFISNGTTYQVIQTNIDPSKYAVKSHTHVTEGTSASTGITPAGTISVGLDDFKSNDMTVGYTPAGTVASEATSTATEVTAAHSLSVDLGTHKHTLTYSTTSVTVTYSKSNPSTGIATATVSGSITASYTPTGTVGVTLTYSKTDVTDTAFNLGSITQDNHSHSFTGTAATLTTKVKPVGTISIPTVNTTTTSFDVITTISVTNSSTMESALTGVASTTTGSFIPTATYSNEVLYLGSADALTSLSFSSASFVKTYGVTLTLTSTNYKPVLDASITVAPTFYGGDTTVSIDYTPEGTLGDEKAAITAITGTISAKYEKGSVKSTQFYGDEETITSTYALTASHHHDITLSNANSSSFTSLDFTKTFEAAVATLSTNAAVVGQITASYDKVSSITSTFTGTLATITYKDSYYNAALGTFYGETATHSHGINITTSTESAKA